MSNKIRPKSRSSMSSIEESTRPLVWTSAILGLTVFEIPIGRPWPKLSVLYSLVTFVAYGFLLKYAVHAAPPDRSDIPMITKVFDIVVAVNIAIWIIAKIFGLWNYKRSQEYCRKITLADETLEVFGIDAEYSAAYYENVRVILFWGGFAIILIVADVALAWFVYQSLAYSVIQFIAYESPQLINPIVQLNFVLKIRAVGKRFERLNALIQSVTTQSIESTSSKNENKYQNILKRNKSKADVKPNFYYRNRNNIELLLKTARQLHLDLCTTARDVNDVWSKAMSMQMAATFVLVTGYSYCVYVCHNESTFSLPLKIRIYVALGLWILTTAMRMIYVVHASVYVSEEAQKTSQLAHEIQISSSQQKLLDEVQQLSLQIMQHPLCFSACGLITLNFGYVRGFVGSVTTYLMILIQNQSDIIESEEKTISINSNATNNTLNS